ncbi:hypothetical protein [Alicyclobacillus hesperidum]|uniref:hypothetical protein n=1 Tax=Alicyclobacillus hesperidum TaxID=89784 RepID=UPI0005901768|nr:hypothetical protein [Alicyclobacillus hesperidum]
MAGNTLDVYRSVKRKIENEFKPLSLTVKSAGFKQDDLAESLSQSTGFWEDPTRVASKPPRWIIQFEKSTGTVKATFAKKSDETLFPSSKTIGYINNREGNCSAMIFRVVASIKLHDDAYQFPNWEWVVFFVFSKPLPAGNSSETITNFDPIHKSIDYQRRSYKYSLLGIVKTTVEDNSIKYGEFGTLTYSEASEALKVLLESGDEVNLV